MELNEKLRNLRNSKLMTQQEVANAVGITVRAVKNYESGARTPRKSIILKLAELFNVDVSEILSDEEDFLITAQEADGSRGKAAAKQLLDNANALFAGGDISEKDKEILVQAIQESYWKSKLKNKKYTPKKYRKDNDNNKNNS